MNHQDFIDLFNQYARYLDNADIEISGEPEIEAFNYYSGSISNIELSTDDMHLDTIDGEYPSDIRYFTDSGIELFAEEIISKLQNQLDKEAISNAVSEALRGSVIASIDNGVLVTRSADSIAREVILSLDTGAA